MGWLEDLTGGAPPEPKPAPAPKPKPAVDGKRLDEILELVNTGQITDPGIVKLLMQTVLPPAAPDKTPFEEGQQRRQARSYRERKARQKRERMFREAAGYQGMDEDYEAKWSRHPSAVHQFVDLTQAPAEGLGLGLQALLAAAGVPVSAPMVKDPRTTLQYQAGDVVQTGTGGGVEHVVGVAGGAGMPLATHADAAEAAKALERHRSAKALADLGVGLDYPMEIHEIVTSHGRPEALGPPEIMTWAVPIKNLLLDPETEARMQARVREGMRSEMETRPQRYMPASPEEIVKTTLQHPEQAADLMTKPRVVGSDATPGQMVFEELERRNQQDIVTNIGENIVEWFTGITQMDQLLHGEGTRRPFAEGVDTGEKVMQSMIADLRAFVDDPVRYAKSRPLDVLSTLAPMLKALKQTQTWHHLSSHMKETANLLIDMEQKVRSASPGDERAVRAAADSLAREFGQKADAGPTPKPETAITAAGPLEDIGAGPPGVGGVEFAQGTARRFTEQTSGVEHLQDLIREDASAGVTQAASIEKGKMLGHDARKWQDAADAAHEAFTDADEALEAAREELKAAREESLKSKMALQRLGRIKKVSKEEVVPVKRQPPKDPAEVAAYEAKLAKYNEVRTAADARLEAANAAFEDAKTKFKAAAQAKRDLAKTKRVETIEGVRETIDESGERVVTLNKRKRAVERVGEGEGGEVAVPEVWQKGERRVVQRTKRTTKHPGEGEVQVEGRGAIPLEEVRGPKRAAAAAKKLRERSVEAAREEAVAAGMKRAQAVSEREAVPPRPTPPKAPPVEVSTKKVHRYRRVVKIQDEGVPGWRGVHVKEKGQPTRAVPDGISPHASVAAWRQAAKDPSASGRRAHLGQLIPYHLITGSKRAVKAARVLEEVGPRSQVVRRLETAKGEKAAAKAAKVEAKEELKAAATMMPQRRVQKVWDTKTQKVSTGKAEAIEPEKIPMAKATDAAVEQTVRQAKKLVPDEIADDVADIVRTEVGATLDDRSTYVMRSKTMAEATMGYAKEAYRKATGKKPSRQFQKEIRQHLEDMTKTDPEGVQNRPVILVQGNRGAETIDLLRYAQEQMMRDPKFAAQVRSEALEGAARIIGGRIERARRRELLRQWDEQARALEENFSDRLEAEARARIKEAGGKPPRSKIEPEAAPTQKRAEALAARLDAGEGVPVVLRFDPNSTRGGSLVDALEPPSMEKGKPKAPPLVRDQAALAQARRDLRSFVEVRGGEKGLRGHAAKYLGLGIDESVWMRRVDTNTLGSIQRAMDAINAPNSRAQKVTRWLKANITARHPATHINNFLANVWLQSMRRGGPDFMVHMADELRDFHAWKRAGGGEGMWNDLLASGAFDVTAIDVELSQLSRMGISGALAHVPALQQLKAPFQYLNRLFEKGYKWGDNVFKLEDAAATYRRIKDDLGMLDDGEKYSVPISPTKRVEFSKVGGEILIDGKAAGDRLGTMIGKAAVQPCQDLFFDYGDVPKWINTLRSIPALGMVAPFVTWQHKALDLPGKGGLMSAMMRSGPDVRTTSKAIRYRVASDAMSMAAKRAGWTQTLQAVALGNVPSKELREIFTYSNSDAGLITLEEMEDDPNIVGVRNYESRNPWGPTYRALRLGRAIVAELYMPSEALHDVQTTILEHLPPEDPTTWTTPEQVEKGTAALRAAGILEEEVLAWNRSWKNDAARRAMGTEAGFTDALELAALNGSITADFVNELSSASKQNRPVDTSKLGRSLLGLAVAGLYQRMIDVGAAALRENGTIDNDSWVFQLSRRSGEMKYQDVPLKPFVDYAVDAFTGAAERYRRVSGSTSKHTADAQVELDRRAKYFRESFVKPIEARIDDYEKRGEKELAELWRGAVQRIKERFKTGPAADSMKALKQLAKHKRTK